MRLLIRLVPLSTPASLPLDNYPFAAVIYRSVWIAAPNYAEFLHEEGYSAESSPHSAQPEHKRFKFFVFSRIEQRGKRIAQGRQWLSPQPVEWRVASPIDEQMELLAAGLAAQGVVSIGDKRGVTDFGVSEILELPSPHINRQMRFTTISPIFVAVDEGGSSKQHLRSEDPRYSERVKINLLRKYKALVGHDPVDTELDFRFDGQPKPQLVQYKDTHHHCYVGRITISGNEELIRLGWECGFGEANSKGFGMVDIR
jgi:CRISPR-associated endoribonuclease Cas6